MKKVIGIVLLITMVLGCFTACGTTLEGDDKGADIRVYMANCPTSFDPSAIQLDADTVKLMSLIYEPLTVIKSDGSVGAGMATEWYSKYDAKDGEYRMYFELKETQWHDGRKVSADDYVYAWKRILSPATNSPYASLLFPIKNAKNVKAGIMTSDDLGLVAADDLLLEVTFEADYDATLFAQTVANIALSPLREDKVSRDKNWDVNTTAIMCSGPFRIQGFEQGAKLVLERNTYYMREEDEYLDEYVLPYRITCYYSKEDGVAEERVEANRYNEGELFYLSCFNAETYAEFSSKIKSEEALSSYNYYFNTKSSASFLGDAKVRKALSIALDRNHIASLVGTGVTPATGIVPNGVFNTKKGTDFRTEGGALYSAGADTDNAKKLLSEAGVSGGSFTLTYLKGNVTAEAVAQYAVSAWKDLGFNVSAKAVSAKNYEETLLKGEYDVIGLDFAGNATDAFMYLAPFATRYSGNIVSIDLESDTYTPHFTNIEDADYDKLVDEVLLVSKDKNDRAAKLHAIEAKLVELSPVTALYYNVNNRLVSSKLSELKTVYAGIQLFTEAELSGYKNISYPDREEVSE